jgi:hypothetical protein
MKAFVTIALCSLLLAAGTAFADASAPLKRARAYTETHQPSGKPTKASSFAPYPGGSKRHVYGAPIQSPIFKRGKSKGAVRPPPNNLLQSHL